MWFTRQEHARAAEQQRKADAADVRHPREDDGESLARRCWAMRRGAENLSVAQIEVAMQYARLAKEACAKQAFSYSYGIRDEEPRMLKCMSRMVSISDAIVLLIRERYRLGRAIDDAESASMAVILYNAKGWMVDQDAGLYV